MRVFAAHFSLAKSGELWPLAQRPVPGVPASAQSRQARECHRRSRGRAIAPAWSSHRRWMAGLAWSPALGRCRPPSAARRAVGCRGAIVRSTTCAEFCFFSRQRSQRSLAAAPQAARPPSHARAGGGDRSPEEQIQSDASDRRPFGRRLHP
eukprot:scaffold2616_cov106-Isochrysis_galbana.AAC.8